MAASQPMMPPPPPPPMTTMGSGMPAKRPTGVTILGVLAIIGGVFAVFAGLALMAMGAFMGAMGAGADSGMMGMFGVLGAAAGVFLLIYAAFAFAVAWGLFNQKRWAWYASLVLAGLQVLSGIISLISMDIFSALIGLAIGGFIVWYLLSPPVQAWFGVSHNAPWKYKQATV